MKDYKTVPNQRIVKMPPVGERIRDKEHLYGMFSIEAAQKVAKDLGASAFVLYMYFQKNQDCYEFALSKEDVSNWGLGKTAYTNAFNALVANGYLVRKDENSNIYYFHEFPEDNSHVVTSRDHEEGDASPRGHATIPHVVTSRDHAWYGDNTTRGSVTLPEIIHNNTNDNKINSTIFCDATAPLGSACGAARELKKENENLEAYKREMTELNNKFFDEMKYYEEKYGKDYNNKEEYITWRAELNQKINGLRAKYNIMQNA